ncbi:hypothetical protein DFH28DRAFT_1123216 [Melampsora americana]|nr:hypothetical protein DFH28DRAFT_1123216 [Melampsora americana]
MSLKNLEFNLLLTSFLNTYFYLKQFILRIILNFKSLDDLKTKENNLIQSYLSKLFSSGKLLTWTLKSIGKNKSSDDQVLSETDRSKIDDDTYFDPCGEDYEFNDLKSSTSNSISSESLTSYSIESEVEEIKTNEFDFNLNSLFEQNPSESQPIQSLNKNFKTLNFKTDGRFEEMEKKMTMNSLMINQDEKEEFFEVEESWDDIKIERLDQLIGLKENLKDVENLNCLLQNDVHLFNKEPKRKNENFFKSFGKSNSIRFNPHLSHLFN